MAEPAPARREAARRLVPGAAPFSSHADLLSSSVAVDALIVCTPPLHHADAVLAGARAGLPVLCEKPLTLDRSAFEAIRSAAVEKGVCVYSVNNWA